MSNAWAVFICWTEWWHLQVITSVLIANTHTLYCMRTYKQAHSFWQACQKQALTLITISTTYWSRWLSERISLLTFTSLTQLRCFEPQDIQLQGLISPQPRQCKLGWQSVVCYFESGRDGEDELKVCECVTVYVYVLDGSIQEFRWQICVTLSFYCSAWLSVHIRLYRVHRCVCMRWR